MFKRYSLRTTVFAATFVLLAACLATAASAVTLSVVGPSLVDVGAGPVPFAVDIIADEDLAVGSTDINVNWDAVGIEATAATSAVLAGFTFNIDNPARQVRTASATFGANNIPAGTPLMTITMLAEPGDEGLYSLFITDGDGLPPDDLAGPVPPVPPDSIPFNSVALLVQVIPDLSTDCADAFDNDGDGLIDLDDPDCSDSADPLEAPDADGDLVEDDLDNCVQASNPVQEDTDGDDYGNACDCDFDQNLACSIADFSIFREDYIATVDRGVGTDMDGNGAVSIADFSLFRDGYVAGEPGPSGLVP